MTKRKPLTNEQKAARRAYYHANRDKIRIARAASYAADPSQGAAAVRRVAEWRKKNPEKNQASRARYRERHQEDRQAYERKFRMEHPEVVLERQRRWHDNNRSFTIQRARDYRKNNPHKIRSYQKVRRDTDAQYRLQGVMRHRAWLLLHHRFKTGVCVDTIGCTGDEFAIHIEGLFQHGMSWDNRGTSEDTWQFDHIVPLSDFDLTDPTQIMAACHYTNVRPLWMMDNHARVVKGRLNPKKI